MILTIKAPKTRTTTAQDGSIRNDGFTGEFVTIRVAQVTPRFGVQRDHDENKGWAVTHLGEPSFYYGARTDTTFRRIDAAKEAAQFLEENLSTDILGAAHRGDDSGLSEIRKHVREIAERN